MYKIEHELATTGFEIEERSIALRPLIAEIRPADHELSGELELVLTALEEAARRLIGVASLWHGVER